jgi:hypothetical protein
MYNTELYTYINVCTLCTRTGRRCTLCVHGLATDLIIIQITLASQIHIQHTSDAFTFQFAIIRCRHRYVI